MRDMPLLGGPRKRSRGWLWIVVLLAFVGAAVVVWRILTPKPASDEPPAVAGTGTTPAAPAQASPDAAPPPPPLDPLQAAGVRYLKATVEGPLETAIVSQVGRELG